MRKTRSFIAIILCLLMAAAAFMPASAYLNQGPEMYYNFADDEAGKGAGEISLQNCPKGTYSIFWGDENGEKLQFKNGSTVADFSALAEITVSDSDESVTLNSFTAIPDGAKTVLAYCDGEKKFENEIPENKIADYGEMTYSFGALSDLHFNRYSDFSDDDAEIAFPRALDFMKNSGASLVAMSGDLSKNGEADAFQKFNKYTSQYNFPVLTCKGNHDCRSEYTLENWQKYVNTGVYSEQKMQGVQDVADNGLDFVFCDEEATGGDVFIFFSQVKRQYIIPGGSLVTDKQLDWLEAQLNKYKDKRVYLFFHTFLTPEIDKSSPIAFIKSIFNIAMGEGNIRNALGLFYPLFYTLFSKDEARFRSLLTENKNVVFFNGHSHWSYTYQSMNSALNISDNGGSTATMVHVSSVSAPRTPSIPLWSSNPGTMSEGAFVAVYENNIVIYNIDFVNNTVYAFATYTVDR